MHDLFISAFASASQIQPSPPPRVGRRHGLSSRVPTSRFIEFPVVRRSSCVVLLASPSVCMCSDCVFVRLCVLRQRRRKAVEGQGIVKSAFSCQPTARMSKISLWLIRWSWQHTDCRQRDWQNTRAHARAHTHNSHTTHTQLTHDSHTQTLLAKKWASKAGKGTATVRMTTNWKGIAQESGY